MIFFVSKWTVKLIFRGAYRLSGTGIVECLEIIDVGYNLFKKSLMVCSAVAAREFLPPGAKVRGAAPPTGNIHPQCTE